MGTNAIIVSKPKKDGSCPIGFKKEGDFCVSSNIQDESITNPETISTAVPTAIVTPASVNQQISGNKTNNASLTVNRETFRQ